jgi:hypothetical protein
MTPRKPTSAELTERPSATRRGAAKPRGGSGPGVGSGHDFHFRLKVAALARAAARQAAPARKGRREGDRLSKGRGAGGCPGNHGDTQN